MRRKLIKQGKEGLTIYIPKKFIDKNNLQGGDEIIISENNNNLILSLEQIKTHQKEVELSFSNNLEGYIRSSIINAYCQGYTQVKINFKTKQDLNHIKSVVNNYILGFEIISEIKNTVIIENILEPEEQKRDILLRRTFILLHQILEETISYLDKNSSYNFSKIENLCYSVEKYVNFLRRRAYLKKFNENSETTYEYYHQFRNISMALKMFYLSLGNKNNNFNSNLLKPYLEVIKLLEKNYFEKNVSNKSAEIVSEALFKSNEDIKKVEKNELEPFLYYNSFLVGLLAIHPLQLSVLLNK